MEKAPSTIDYSAILAEFAVANSDLLQGSLPDAPRQVADGCAEGRVDEASRPGSHCVSDFEGDASAVQHSQASSAADCEGRGVTLLLRPSLCCYSAPAWQLCDHDADNIKFWSLAEARIRPL